MLCASGLKSNYKAWLYACTSSIRVKIPQFRKIYQHNCNWNHTRFNFTGKQSLTSTLNAGSNLLIYTRNCKFSMKVMDFESVWRSNHWEYNNFESIKIITNFIKFKIEHTHGWLKFLFETLRVGRRFFRILGGGSKQKNKNPHKDIVHHKTGCRP